MDPEDNLVSALDSDQASAVDSVIGKKIWNIEVIEDGDQSVVKIMFSEDEESNYILFHAEGMDMYIVHEVPKTTH